MSEDHALSPDLLSRLARQHLESLRAAGVDWLPTGPLPPALAVAGPVAEAPDRRRPPARLRSPRQYLSE